MPKINDIFYVVEIQFQSSTGTFASLSMICDIFFLTHLLLFPPFFSLSPQDVPSMCSAETYFTPSCSYEMENKMTLQFCFSALVGAS